MTYEALRIADQLTRAFSGDAWHGPPLSDLLTGVSAAQASNRALVSAHSIWELVIHIDMYTGAAIGAVQGIAMPRWYETGQDWPPLVDLSDNAWKEAKDRLFQHAEQLASEIRGLQDSRLLETVPGREYNFYHLFHGIVQHSLYHGGQIAILKKVSTAQ